MTLTPDEWDALQLLSQLRKEFRVGSAETLPTAFIPVMDGLVQKGLAGSNPNPNGIPWWILSDQGMAMLRERQAA